MYVPHTDDPELMEGDIFRILIRLSGLDTSELQTEAQVKAQVEAQVEAQAEVRILKACAPVPLSSAEIAVALGHKQLSGNLRKALPRLRKSGLLEYTIPDKPNSPLQKYRLTNAGKRFLESMQK